MIKQVLNEQMAYPSILCGWQIHLWLEKTSYHRAQQVNSLFILPKSLSNWKFISAKVFQIHCHNQDFVYIVFCSTLITDFSRYLSVLNPQKNQLPKSPLENFLHKTRTGQGETVVLLSCAVGIPTHYGVGDIVEEFNELEEVHVVPPRQGGGQGWLTVAHSQTLINCIPVTQSPFYPSIQHSTGETLTAYVTTLTNLVKTWLNHFPSKR